MGNGEIKKIIFLAVTVAVIANLLLGNIVLAKKLEITDKGVGQIKNGLDLVKMLVNLSVNDSKLKTVLSAVISGGKTGTDVTYGILVLTSLNEMDFIDSVVSQRYKGEATAYFDSILDERLNLTNYYKGIGYDLPRALAGKITSPVAALTLNTFDITDKAITILSMIKVLEKEMKYDGLWVYFDQRRGNDSHEEAWEFAETKIGGTDQAISFSKSKARNGKKTQLEQQFAILYDKWGPYTDEKGIKEEFKQQVKEELRNTIVSAIQAQKLTEERPVPGLLDKIKLAFENLVKESHKIGGMFKEEIAKINTRIQALVGIGGAEVSQTLKWSEVTITGSDQGLTPLEPKTEETSQTPQKITFQSVLEEIAEITEKIEQKPEPEPVLEKEALIEVKPQLTMDETITQGIPKAEQKVAEKLCEKTVGTQPLRNGVIFQEIAWMGSQNSANDEWLKLKNISGSEADLTGWQILDKDQQIKIIFSENWRGLTSPIALNEIVVFERTNDDSLPGVSADLIYTGALNDSDEAVYLFDNNCQLRDEVLASPDWPGGDKENRKPMARNTDLSWQAEAAATVVFNYGTPTPYSLPPTLTATKILISEVQISPLGDRFVELYNPNNQAVNLTDWYIQRKTQTGSSFNSFIASTNFQGKTIGALSYFLVASSTSADIFSSLTLTEGNSLRLKNPDQEIIDEVIWENPATGKSWGRQWSTTTQSYSDFEVQTPTPKAQNQSPSQSSNQAPGAFFVYTPSSPFTVGQEVVFNAASSSDSDGAITSFVWDFGDSSSATTSQATTTHSFLAAGNFLISLVVSDNNNATSSPATTTVAVAVPETPSLSVAINEIAWAGTKANSSGEWLELYNNTTSTIDLAGWTLKALDGTPSTTFSSASGTTTIPAGGYFLLERTNSGTTNAREDYTFTGALNNDGEKLGLRDGQNNLIDSVDFSSGWPAGSSTPNYISMERISATNTAISSNWASNNLITRNGLDASLNKINGTPRSQNSVSVSSTTISSLADLFNEFSEITLTYYGGPYIIQNNLTVPASNTLKIEPKTILKFNSLKKIDVAGKLEAIGGVEAENKIIFTANSSSPVKGFWQGILFSNAINSRIENAIIKYGKIALEIKSGSQSIINNTFEANETPILISSNTASTTFSGNTAQNNNINGILTDSSTIMVDTVWQSDANFPFVIDYAKSVDAGKTLTIKEGTVVKIKPQTGSGWTGYFDVNGRLITEGTSASPIVITAFSDDEYGGDTNNDGTSTLPVSGSWRWLRFNSLTATSTLDGTRIRYGGGSCDAGFCWGAILQSVGVGIEIKNSVIEKNIRGIFSNESGCQNAFQKIKLENTAFSQNNINIYLGSGNQCQP